MSVVTRADECLTEVKEQVNSAVINLSEIVVDQCWGYDDLSEDSKSKYKEIFLMLLSIRDKL